MKINFERLEIFQDIEKKICRVYDARKEFANTIYLYCTGIEYHALAFKIFNSKGEEDYTDEEVEIIKIAVERFGTPSFIDSVKDKLKQ